MTIQEQMIALKNDGKTHYEIAKITNYSRSSVDYILGREPKKKYGPTISVLDKKLSRFVGTSIDIEKFNEIKNKIIENPVCYLTGEIIDLNNSTSYNLDHKLPISRGGKSDPENLGLCTGIANRCKTNLTPDEFLNFCKTVLEYHGYKITK